MKKFLKLLPLFFSMVLVGCAKPAADDTTSEPEIVESSEESESTEESEITESSEETESEEISYTAAEAIDAVADIMSEIFGQSVTAYHEDGDYIVLNFGSSVDAETLKGYCGYFIPEGFELALDWAEDQFEDGTPVNYTVYVCGNVALQFAVYNVDGYEGDQAGYNGLYLQIDAYLIEE